jgi:hypothetical protein
VRAKTREKAMGTAGRQGKPACAKLESLEKATQWNVTNVLGYNSETFSEKKNRLESSYCVVTYHLPGNT